LSKKKEKNWLKDDRDIIILSDFGQFQHPFINMDDKKETLVSAI
jgi:hypothetical protein